MIEEYIIEILFALALVIYIAYKTAEKHSRDLDSDLLNSMNIIAASLKKGDSLETAIVDISKGTDSAAKLFKNILEQVKKGKSLAETFESSEKRYHSPVLSSISKLISVYEKSTQDISKQLKKASKTMMELKQTEEQLLTVTSSPVMVVQIMAIFVAPTVMLFLPGILELGVYKPSFYFTGFAVAVYSFMDYIMYSDLKESLFILPLFITGYLVVITRLAPFAVGFFLGIF